MVMLIQYIALRDRSQWRCKRGPAEGWTPDAICGSWRCSGALIKIGGTMEFTLDPTPRVRTLLGRQHSNDRSPDLDPLARYDFAVMGSEVNGKYYEAAK